MTRRGAIGALFGISLRAAQSVTTAIVLDMVTGAVVDSLDLDAAGRRLSPPGSTLKPLILAALLDSGKLRPTDAFPCSGRLTLTGRSFACVHPRMNAPVDVPAAIAYSCNEYTVHAAQRFTPAEQAAALRRYGLGSLTHLSQTETAGQVEPSSGVQAQLQALGEENIQVTVLGLVAAYRMLASRAPQAVLRGLEGAVEFGTARNAGIPGVRVAGKTGSAGNGRWAWFAGFAPSAGPRFVVAVLTQGSSGGADAAPIASQLLQRAFRRQA